MYLISCLLLVFIGHLTILNAAVDFYSHIVTDIDGKPVSLETYRGKAVLVVNVASECGFTDKHYRGLVRAKQILGSDEFFEILAFPCNQFGAQEPKSNGDILAFANGYSVNFPMFSKINVIDTNVPGVWRYITEKSGHPPNWNFWKYLVDHSGNVLGFWGPWSDVEEIFPKLQAATDAARAATRKTERAAGMPQTQTRPPAPISPPAQGVQPPTRAPVDSNTPRSPPKPPAARGLPTVHDDL